MRRFIFLGMVFFLGVSLWGIDAPFAAGAQMSDEPTQIPVLCYHRFGDYGAKDAYSISMAEFSEQLEIIKQEKMTPMTVTELDKCLRGEATLPVRPMLITIDDGYRDFLAEAKPLLEQYGYTATLFIYTEFVGARLGLKKQELKSLQAAGFDIGSHSASHPKLNRFKKGESKVERQAWLTKELEGSREKLRTWSEGDVLGLAYPYGLWTAEVASIAQAAGYTLLFTVNPGTNSMQSGKTCLKRNMVLRGTRKATFRAMLTMRELVVTSWNPPIGEVVQGSLPGIQVVLDPALHSVINPRQFRVTTGGNPIPSTYDEKNGTLDIRFAKPWTKGTDLIVLTAKDHEGMLQYKQSRLVQFLPVE